MPIAIRDGQGSKRTVGVRDDHRLKVAASNIPEAVLASERGDSFFVDTEVVTLATPAQVSALLYMRNDSEKHLHIRNVAFQTDFVRADLLFFPPVPSFDGTLIDDAVLAQITNTNFTSGKTPEVIAYQGTAGKTVNGSGAYTTIRMGNGPDQIENLEVLIMGQGDAIAFGMLAVVACVAQISISAYYTTNGD